MPPTSTSTPTLSLPPEAAYLTYARGELLPDMRVPVERSNTGEGGWYVVIGSQEGWQQFLAQMGQPAQIWESVQWDKEILVGAMLGVRKGRGYAITIDDLTLDGVSAVADITFDSPSADQPVSLWFTYPYHLVRVPRLDLPLGSVGFRFTSQGEVLAEQSADLIDLDILWLRGQQAVYPTPTLPPSTSTPVPTSTSTPVPNLQVMGTVLQVLTDTLSLQIIHPEGEWEYVDLLAATSIFDPQGQPASLAQILPGTTIAALGYAGDEQRIRAAHIDIVDTPTDLERFASYKPRETTLSTIYDGYRLPLGSGAISATQPISLTFTPTQSNVLTRTGFVVVPSDYRSFAELYADPEHAQDPVFCSVDSALHVSQLLLDHVFGSVQLAHVAAELESLDRQMFELSWDQYQSVQPADTPQSQRLAATALRNAAYFAVPLRLLDDTFVPPAVISEVVGAEMTLIQAGEVITVSPLLDLPGMRADDKLVVDYRSFVPPSRFSGDAPEQSYYRAITWHREIAFRVTQQAISRCQVMAR